MNTSTLLSAVRGAAALAVLMGGTAAFAQQPAAAPARVGIVMPKAQLGQGHTGQDVAEPVKQLIIAYMQGPVVEIVPLGARIPQQIEAEARAAGCTHVLYTSVEQKKGKKGLGGLLSKAAPVAGMLPVAGALGDNPAGAMMAGAAQQAIMTAATQSAAESAMESLVSAQAGTVKKRDEITLEYQLVRVDGAAQPLAESLSAKAEQDGEDLLTPLVEQLATRAITSVTAAPAPASP